MKSGLGRDRAKGFGLNQACQRPGGVTAPAPDIFVPGDLHPTLALPIKGRDCQATGFVSYGQSGRADLNLA